MKEWLEEKDMPKDCATCKYYVLNCSDTYSCIKQNGKVIHPNFSDGMGYRHEDCPLQSLSDYTKQVRKEVVQEIFRAFNRKIDDEFGDNDTKYITLDVEEVNFYLKDLVERMGEEQ